MSPILYSIAVAALYSSAASGSVWVTADKNGRRVLLVVMAIYICIGGYACVVSDPVGLIIIAYTIFGIFFGRSIRALCDWILSDKDGSNFR